MKLPPVISFNFWVSDRATMSVEAPGAKATTKLTGLALGHSLCAQLVICMHAKRLHPRTAFKSFAISLSPKD
jgi:hypothetical protein